MAAAGVIFAAAVAAATFVAVLAVTAPTVTVPMDSDQEAVLAAVTQEPKIAKLMEGKEIVKTIHVPNKLVNLILKPQA